MKSAFLLLDLQNEMVDPKGKIGSHGLAATVAAAGLLDHAARPLGRPGARRLQLSMSGSASVPTISIA